jgi:hypothetical protein
MDEYVGLFLVILTIFSVVVLILLLSFTASKISPSQCKTCKGTYGVTPGSEGALLSTCGADKQQPCSFLSTSLLEATSMCTADPLCTSFTYDELSGLFYYNLNDTTTPASGDTDVYFKL